MMQFLFWPLTWGFLLMGVPILVHLINLLRHRRQKWAAMEFLLESHRRNRRWVMLKQWLLLLARILAMALLVIMLAKWVTNSQWISMLGGRINHHFVLLDDSYSMSAVGPQNESAYERALRAVSGLLSDIASQPGDHQITLIRMSRAELAMRAEKASVESQSESDSLDRAADLLAQSIPRDPQRLIERLNATKPTGMACSPETAIELVTPAVSSQSGELPIVYLLTDLRRGQFADSEALSKQFQQMSEQGVPIHLIDCGDAEPANLTITSLVPEQEVWASNVPMLARFSIKNNSTQSARNVVVKIRSIEYPSGSTSPIAEQEYSGKILDQPPMVIESIESGQTVTRQFQVVFSAAGHHVLEVTIPDDSLMTDNRRWSAISIQRSQRVLLVDGDPKQSNAFFLESVIDPGERLNTGLTFERVDASYLRDVSREELLLYDTIAILDVPRLDVAAIDNLLQFSTDGGGLFMVLGENTNLNFANDELFRDGKGILPVELEQLFEAMPPIAGDARTDLPAPQVTATEHALLQPLRRLSSSPFFALQIRKFWMATAESIKQPGLEVVAYGPDGHPLIVDKPIGIGRVLAVLTGFGQEWSSWAQDPTFVVVALRSLGYLGSFRREPTEAPVANRIEMTVADSSVLPEADVLLPARGGSRVRLLRGVEKNADQSISRLSLTARLSENIDREVFDGLLHSGIFECWMTNADGTFTLKNIAHNVAPEEGDLERIGHQEVYGQFPGVDLDVRSASSFVGQLGARESSQSNLAMALLVLLLIGEQILAYSASFHPRASTRQSSSRGVANQSSGGTPMKSQPFISTSGYMGPHSSRPTHLSQAKDRSEVGGRSSG